MITRFQLKFPCMNNYNSACIGSFVVNWVIIFECNRYYVESGCMILHSLEKRNISFSKVFMEAFNLEKRNMSFSKVLMEAFNNFLNGRLFFLYADDRAQVMIVLNDKTFSFFLVGPVLDLY